ncbi:MAG: hypothetical protein EOP48_12180 [Sphingobacteriales bacterium]|nr:MAG: hypothetical protein EOP48_12180 [Sphingobacteriales bacterium]
MNKSLIVTIFALQTFLVHAGKFDFRLYNQKINNAESAIIDEQYSVAIKYYREAFVVKEKPFAKDLYNASLCAIKVNNVPLAFKFCKLLAQKGVGSGFFKAVPSYTKLPKNSEWNSVLKQAGKSKDAHQIASGRILRTIDSLVEKDQKFNREWRESGMAVEQRERMYAANDTISSELKQMFDSLGFLSEDKIGATLNKNGLLSNILPFDVILVHNYQSRTQGDTLFSVILHEALLNGDISPDYYATILDMGTNLGNRPYYGAVRLFTQYKCKILLDDYNQNRISDIDRSRAAIGLCSTKELLKKVVYKITNPASEFKVTVQLTIRDGYDDPDMDEAALKSSVIVLDNIPNCKS